jgi:hypothetical protein
MSTADFSALDAVGLNLQAVVDLDALPAAMRGQLDPARRRIRSTISPRRP